MPEPNMEKYIKGQFSLTPEEVEKAKKVGNLSEQKEKMEEATEQLRKKGGIIELSEEEEKNAVVEGKKALRELNKRFRKDQPGKAELRQKK